MRSAADGGAANNYTAWHQNEIAKAKMSPSCLIIVVECHESVDSDMDNYSNSYTFTDLQRHGNINYLLTDGHAEGLRFFDSEKLTYFTTKMSAWE